LVDYHCLVVDYHCLDKIKRPPENRFSSHKTKEAILYCNLKITHQKAKKGRNRMITNSMSFGQKFESINLEVIVLKQEIEKKKKQQQRLIQVEKKVNPFLKILEETVLEIKQIDPKAITEEKEKAFLEVLGTWKNTMAFEERINTLSSEIIGLEKEIEEKKKEQQRLIKFETEEKVDLALNALEKSILEIKRMDPEAIADFKERALSIFNTHLPHAVTMEEILEDEEDEVAPIKGVEDYVIWVTRRCGLCWGYEIESVENIKTGFLSRVNQVDGYSYDDPDLLTLPGLKTRGF